jgi:hypothetical protein
MRRIFRIGIFLLLLVTVAWFSRETWLNFLGNIFGLSTRTAGETTTGFVYRLEPENDLVFNYTYTPVLRLITNATVPAGEEPQPGESLPYAIQYKILDSDDNVLESKTYHLASSLSHFKDPDTGKIYWDSFMEGKKETPMDGRITLINLKNIKTDEAVPRQLRLRLAEKDNRLLSIAVRVYQQFNYPDYKRKIRWQRKARKTKEHLARGNIYPVDLLTESEKRNLAAAEWEVLAPQGVPGRDFRRETVYTLKEITGIPIYPIETWTDIESGVLYAGPSLKGIIPLPETGGAFRFYFTKIDITDAPEKTDSNGDAVSRDISLTWYGRKPGSIESYTLQLQPDQTNMTTFQANLPGGLVEIQSPEKVSITVESQTAQNKAIDITPHGLYLKSYLCWKNSPLEYNVFHTANRSIPFRIDLRALLADKKGNAAAPASQGEHPPQWVTYQMLDKKKVVLEEGKLSVEAIPSLYDRPTNGDTMRSVSEKYSHYLLVPPEVKKLRFIDNAEPVLVSVFNRPPGLRRHARVPEDDFAFHRQDETRKTRDWFMLKPVNHQELEQHGSVTGLLIQPRPPQTAEHLLSGDYRWEAPINTTPVWGRLLLVKRDNPIPPKPDLLPLLYREIPVKEPGVAASPATYTFREQHQPEETAQVSEPTPVEPEMVFYNPGGKLRQIRLQIDEAPYWEGQIGGTGGKLRLPPLPVGRHRLKATGPPGTRLWINGTQPKIPASPSATEIPLYFLRLVYKLDSRSQTFQFNKEMPEEMLGFQVFSPVSRTGQSHHVSLQVDVNAKRRSTAKRYDDWTILHRTYHIRSAGGQGSPLLYTGGLRLDEGQTAFFPLGTDIAPGPLKVTLTFTGSPGHYILPYRLIPGRFEESRIDIAPIATMEKTSLNTNAKAVNTGEKSRYARLKTMGLGDAWEDARKGVKYKPLPAAVEEHRRMTDLFKQLMRQTIPPDQSPGNPGKFPSELHDAFKLQGWDLLRTAENPAIIAVTESPGRKEGRGFYLVRLGSAPPVLMQAPHSGSDMLTGTITIKMFREHNIKAAAFNTVHRKQIDLAHRYDTAFQAMTLAFAAQNPGGRVIQWHGFNAAIRPTKKERMASAIISNGTRSPSPSLIRIVRCLGIASGGTVYVFPTGINKLGATTNSQGNALRKMRFYDFIHLELSLPWRKKLSKEKTSREAWFRCLTKDFKDTAKGLNE